MSEDRTDYWVGDQLVISVPQDAIAEISGHYAMIPEGLIRAGQPAALAVYGALDRIARGDKRQTDTSASYLASYTALGISTVRRALIWLEENQFVEVRHAGPGRTTNRYLLPFRSTRWFKMNHHMVTGEHQMVQNEPQTNSTTPVVLLQEQGDAPAEDFATAVAQPSAAPKGAKAAVVAKTATPGKTFTDDDRQRLIAKYQGRLEDPAFHIDQALNHRASNSWKIVSLGVDGWLRREATRAPAALSMSKGGIRPSKPKHVPDYTKGLSPPSTPEQKAEAVRLRELNHQREINRKAALDRQKEGSNALTG